MVSVWTYSRWRIHDSLRVSLRRYAQKSFAGLPRRTTGEREEGSKRAAWFNQLPAPWNGSADHQDKGSIREPVSDWRKDWGIAHVVVPGKVVFLTQIIWSTDCAMVNGLNCSFDGAMVLGGSLILMMHGVLVHAELWSYVIPDRANGIFLNVFYACNDRIICSQLFMYCFFIIFLYCLRGIS